MIISWGCCVYKCFLHIFMIGSIFSAFSTKNKKLFPIIYLYVYRRSLVNNHKKKCKIILPPIMFLCLWKTPNRNFCAVHTFCAFKTDFSFFIKILNIILVYQCTIQGYMKIKWFITQAILATCIYFKGKKIVCLSVMFSVDLISCKYN